VWSARESSAYGVSIARLSEIQLIDSAFCDRYELGGDPLPYQTDAIFQKLVPTPQSGVTKRNFCSPSLPKCSKCGSDRVFECQLMPNLINVLGSASAKESIQPLKAISDAERRKALEKELKERSGMEWGTVMIFSCAADCCPDGRECLAEEEVLIQWET
jgi:pre-rRNA-processing protein TSR4